jgi:hypothetical protein
MKLKFLYLDDEDIQTTKSIPELLESENEELSIVVKNPLPFASQIKQLKDEQIDGLILDLRLDQFKHNNQKAEYRATTLAQEIRSRSSEGLLSSFPIIICSTDSKLKKSFYRNLGEQEVFDMKFLKNEDMIDNAQKTARELVSLAKGYKLISQIGSNKKNTNLSDYFRLKNSEVELLDERLINHFSTLTVRLPVHEYAKFILRELVLKQSVLIDEGILQSRLGLNETAKGERGYSVLMEILSKFAYVGPFHEAWPRWWWPQINDWWHSFVKPPRGVATLTASERIQAINSKLKLRLKPAEPISPNYERKFWTICQFYKLPLDLFDGLLLDLGYELLPWQDPLYISLKAAVDPNSRLESFKINSIDKARYEDYKKLSK